MGWSVGIRDLLGDSIDFLVVMVGHKSFAGTEFRQRYGRHTNFEEAFETLRLIGMIAVVDDGTVRLTRLGIHYLVNPNDLTGAQIVAEVERSRGDKRPEICVEGLLEAIVSHLDTISSERYQVPRPQLREQAMELRELVTAAPTVSPSLCLSRRSTDARSCRKGEGRFRSAENILMTMIGLNGPPRRRLRVTASWPKLISDPPGCFPTWDTVLA